MWSDFWPTLSIHSKKYRGYIRSYGLAPVIAPPRQYQLPVPEDGTVFDYKFIKEVGAYAYECDINSSSFLYLFFSSIWELVVFDGLTLNDKLALILFLFNTTFKPEYFTELCRIS